MGKILYRNTTAVICLLIMLICSKGIVRADMQEHDLFEQAYEYYLSYNPEKALETFDLFLKQFPESSALDSILFWRGKSLMQMNKQEEAATVFRSLREKYPDSSYSGFAEKELVTLGKSAKRPEKSDLQREGTPVAVDTKSIVHDDRINKLETEKMELSNQLSALEKKRDLSEQNLSRVLDEKKALEGQLDTLKKVADELAQKVSRAEITDKEMIRHKEEKTVLESQLKERDQKIAVLSGDVGKHIEERNKLNADINERSLRIAKLQESIAIQEKRVAELEKEKEGSSAALNDKVTKTAQERAAVEEELKAERKKTAVLAGEKAEREAALQREVKELEKAKQDLEAKDKANRELTVQIAEAKKVREELAAKTVQAESTEKGLRKLQEDKQKLEQRIKEADGKIGELTLKAQAAQDKDRELKVLADNLKEADRKQKESELALKKVQQDKSEAAGRVQEQQTRIAKLQESIAIQEKRVAELEKEKVGSSAALNDKVTKTAQERAAVEEELKAEKKKTAVLAGEKAEREAALQKEVKELEKAKQDLEAKDKANRELTVQIAEAKKVREELAAKTVQAESTEKGIRKLQEDKQKLEQRIKESDGKIAEYEKPYLRIGKDRYSLASIISESTTAKQVIDKIQAKNMPWITGNLVEDFIVEQVMERNAKDSGIAIDESARKVLSKKYSLSAKEEAYIAKYLVIADYYRKENPVPTVDDLDIKAYYDSHKDQYLLKQEYRVRVLSIKHKNEDELEKSLVAVEMHGDALQGIPFGAIAKKYASIAVVREMLLSDLPEWVRIKISDSKENEISNIIAADNEFMIIQMIPVMPVYRPFAEARKDIESRLFSERSARNRSLQDWLRTLKKDIEYLR